ncbi:ferrochelatase [Curtobacterium sp. VKM Ac-2865]|uniref:ferrochelatase n=1 Tax=Curtobacterium sp. VKM Ac-2865 TaxID=2783817 RepID=UPI00188BF511|nr:ferrochelatase [Curtobacterium sp. VKM Ac-2865]MBF4582474.1 ferrochelatase [Curtobacterium sp. VKM Ac-2865]
MTDTSQISNGRPVLAATAAAASGPEHVEVPTAYDAILLAGFGGPEGQDDVIPFLRNVTRGRGIPDERLEEVAHHYRHFGGVSPINAQNRALKAALEAELQRRGIDMPVLWGNRNWDPYLADAFKEAADKGYGKLIAIATSAYSSFSSCRQYREDYARVLDETGLIDTIQIDKVRQFFDHPGFVQPFVDGVRDGLARAIAENDGLDVATELRILFSTHSIPSTDAAKSGPDFRGFGDGGAYAAQHEAVAQVVLDQAWAELVEQPEHAHLQGTTKPTWKLVYQSRSGPPTQPWLEPDINDYMNEELKGGPTRAVLIVPLGFVSDHMEVMWDLDEEATETAGELGYWSLRTQTPGIDPAYVAGLIDLVLERVNGVPTSERPHVTDIGPWYDVCRPGCCENERAGFKPAAAGLAP